MVNDELKNLIYKLNDDLWNTGLSEKGWYFSYEGNECFDAIKLNDEVIWSSENETREWIEIENEDGEVIDDGDYETWQQFMVRILSEKINKYTLLKDYISGKVEDY